MAKGGSDEKASEIYFGHDVKKNRFGDKNLAKPFVWKKKWAKELPKLKGKKLRQEVNNRLSSRKVKLKKEVEQVKKMRVKRQQEKEDMERMREDIERQAAREDYGILNQKEEHFHKEQVREGSLIRIQQGREGAFDQVFKVYLFAQSTRESVEKSLGLEGLAARLEREVSRSKGRSLNRRAREMEKELEKMLEILPPHSVLAQERAQKGNLKSFDAKVGQIIDLEGETEFWTKMEKISVFLKSRKEEYISDKIRDVLEPKSLVELEEIQRSVAKKVGLDGRRSDFSGFDYEYWEKLLPFVEFFIAKISASKFYEKAVSMKIEMKKDYEKLIYKGRKRKYIYDEELKEKRREKEKRRKTRKIDDPYNVITVGQKRGIGDDAKFLEPALFIAKDKAEMDAALSAALSSESFFEILSKRRISVLSGLKKDKKHILKAPQKSQSQVMLDRESIKKLGEDEEVFRSSEVEVAPDGYWWQNKFRPRKPLYFNKIKAGYDWNHYNRSHYDQENPPQKIVQGYKFNVFYPDLIDMKTAPSFSIHQIPEDKDYVIIKFKGGAPYEDVAFKIVNREWSEEARRGYRSTFNNGVLQLFFNFRNYRYRR